MSRVIAIRDINGDVLWQASPDEIAAAEAESLRVAAESDRYPRPLLACGAEDAEVKDKRPDYQSGCGAPLPRHAMKTMLPAWVVREVPTAALPKVLAIRSVDDIHPGDQLGPFHVVYTCPTCGKHGRGFVQGCTYTPGAWDE
jgi:hypothetical protein